MHIEIVRKPPENRNGIERLKISLLGDHTLDAKSCMFLQAIALLHSKGFLYAGASDLYLPLIDRSHHPLTHFTDGTLISDHVIKVHGPYECAADQYDRKFRPAPAVFSP